MREGLPEAGDLTARGVSSAAGSPVRVRFSPSPTGYFHVGGARTALFNWAFARQHAGTFILRIEDTDSERNREDWVDGILAAMRWIGAPWDEGPYRQSERRPLYDEAADALFEAGRVYACDCTREAVEERTRNNPVPGYDGYCRERRLERGLGRALRFRVPDNGVTIVHDLIRGDVEFAHSTIEDFVIVRSNGEPLFVLANCVDDREMEISHVIRAEEHLPTTPKAVLLWEALDEAMAPVALPLYAHLSVLVNEKRQKISKRRDRVALEDYEADGYLPEATANYLCLLGWSPPGGDEFFSAEEFVANFRLEDATHSPAFFDNQKLLHFNGVYIRGLSDEEFDRRVREWAELRGLSTEPYTTPQFRRLAPLVKERVSTLGEVPSYLEFLFVLPFTIEKASYDKAIGKDAAAHSIVRAARDGFAALPEWRAEELRGVLEEVALSHGRKLGRAQAPVRVATLGRSVGLPLFESLEVLGREETLTRLGAVLTESVEQIP